MSNKIKQLTTVKSRLPAQSFFLAGLMLVSLSFQTEYNDPFNTPKLILLLVLTGWLFGYVAISFKRYPMKKTIIEISLLILVIGFISSLLFALLNTDFFYTGLIGDIQRKNGFLHYLCMVVIFIYLVRFINFYNLQLVLKSIVLIGFISGAYGLIQIFGFDFVNWNNPYNSMISTTGNPNFASALLGIIGVISLLMFIINKNNQKEKILFLIVFLICIFDIYKSESRQGFLVVLFGLITFFFLFVNYRLKKLKILFNLGIFTLISLVVLGMLQIGPLTNWLYKESVSVRGYYWRAAIKMFQEYPLTGVGLDRYLSFFKEFRDESYPLKYGYEINSSNAHNVFLQFFATGGFFVGLFYLLLMAFVLYRGLNFVKKSTGDNQLFMIILISGWAAFHAQSLISIDNLVLSLLGWSLGGIILGLSDFSVSLDENNFRYKQSSVTFLNFAQKIISLVVLIPVAFITVNLDRSERQTYLIRTVANENLPENKELISKLTDQLFKNPLLDPYYKFQVSLLLVDVGLIEKSKVSVEGLSKDDPRGIDYLTWLALYESGESDYAKAIALREDVAKLDPWGARNFLELGLLYQKVGNQTKVESIREKINTMAPNSVIANEANERLVLN